MFTRLSLPVLILSTLVMHTLILHTIVLWWGHCSIRLLLVMICHMSLTRSVSFFRLQLLIIFRVSNLFFVFCVEHNISVLRFVVLFPPLFLAIVMLIGLNAKSLAALLMPK